MSKNILLVDDDEFFAINAKLQLKGEGFELCRAETGEKIPDILAASPDKYALVLINADLFPLSSELRNAAEILNSKSIPLIFLSSRSESEISARTSDITSYGYYIKGSGFSILLALVKMAFRMRKTYLSLREKEGNLNRAREKFEISLEIAKFGSWEYDVATDIFTFDNQFLSLWGIDRQEGEEIKLSGNQYLNKFIHPEDLQFVREEIRKTMQTKDPDFFKQFDHRIIHTSGEVRYLSIYIKIKMDSAGRIIKRYGVLQDVTERKRIEKEKLDSEKKYRSLYESLLDGFISTDLTGNIIDFNDPVVKMLGSTPEALKGKSILDLTPSKWHAYEMEIINKQVMVKGHSETFEKEYIKPDGTVFPAELRIYLNRDEKGMPVSLWAFVRDITKRKQAEEQLRIGEQKYRELFNSNKDGISIFYINPDGTFTRFVEMNDAAHKLLGYTKEEFSCFTALDLQANATKEGYDFIRQEISSRGVASFETVLKHKNGSLVDVEIRVVPIIYNDRLAMMNIVRDIAQRKSIEKALRQSEEKYRLMLEMAPDAFMQGDYLGRFISCNDKAAQLTGFEKEELRTKTMFDLFTAESLKNQPLRLDLLTSGKTMINEREIIRKDGSKITVEMNSSIMPDGTYQSFFRDITGRKKAEEALRKSEEQYRNLFERANDAILIFEPETEIIMDANQKACSNYGFTKEELVGLSIKSISRNVKRGEEHVRKLLDKGRYEEFETQQYRKDGSIVHFLINASVIEYNGRKAILSINRDISERKLAEERVRLLSQTVKSVSQGVSVTDLNNNIIFVNQAFLDVYGYCEEELIGKHISIVNADPKPQYRKIIDATIAQGWHGELLNRRKDGTLFPIYLHTSAVLDDNKEPIGLVGVMTDISENKKAERELADKNKNLQFLNSLAVEFADFPLENDLEQFILSKLYKFTAPELAIYSEYSYAGNSLGTKHFSSRSDLLMEAFYINRKHLAAVDWNIYNSLVSQTIRKQSSLSNISAGVISPSVRQKIEEINEDWHFYEISFVAGGRFFGVALLGFTDESRLPSDELLNSFSNLAAVSLSRRFTEIKLKESEEQFRTIFENAVLGIYRTLPSGKIEMVNKALCRMLGYSSEEELLKVNLEDKGFHPTYERSAFKEKVTSDNYITLESSWKKADGTIIYIRENARAIRNISGEILYFDGTVEDITIQKEAQEEILRINKKLKELNATKDKLFSIIAHDLRGPFSGILGLSELLANNMETLDESEIQRCTRVLHTTSQRLYQLLTNLLEWSRIQTGKLEFRPSELFVFDEVENIRQLFAPNASKKHIMLLNNVDRNITINADAHYFSTVLRNLISNAIKFTKQNGTITINSSVNGNRFELSVSDTGVGMSQDVIDMIFRIDAAHTTRGTNNEQGTGLGLVLCRELIERSGGGISVKSSPGEGTSFTIYLPRI